MINNLLMEVELGDDISFEILFIVINVIDLVVDSIFCMLIFILLEIINFRVDDYLNGSMYYIVFCYLFLV